MSMKPTYEQLEAQVLELSVKLANVESKCTELVAENAALKSKAAELVHEASEVYSAYNATIAEPDGDFMDMQTLQEMQCVETPATDAAIANIQAHGVEMLAEDYRVKLSALPTTPENMFDSAHVILRSQIFDADEFAAQIRQGAKS